MWGYVKNLYFDILFQFDCTKIGGFKAFYFIQIFEAFVSILLIVHLSFNQTVLTFLLYVRQTWMAQLILAISLWGYLPLILKDSSTHMHVLVAYVKEGLPFAQDVSLENSADSYLCFWLALCHSVLYFFFLYLLLSLFLCMVFDSISFNIDEVL